MKGRLLFFCFLTIFLNGISQDTAITYFNRNWEKTKAEKAFYTLIEINYNKNNIYVEYFDNSGKLIVNGYYTDNYMDSTWIMYNPKNDIYDTLNYSGIKDLFCETAYNHPFETVFIIAEDMPKFGTGIKNSNEDFREYVNNHLHYPIRATQNKIEGKVFITFIIGTDGKVYNPKAVVKADKDITFEAIRVIRNSPLRLPGKQRNKEVAIQFTMPIVFILK